MNYRKLARHLIEKNNDATAAVKIYADRIMLRLVDSPSLLAYLNDAVVVQAENGTYKLQFEFDKLPSEVLPMLRQVLGKEVVVKEYGDTDKELHGVEIELDTEDLGCDEEE